jgi:hypothetical protein
VAQLRFGILELLQCHRLPQVAFWEEMVSVLVLAFSVGQVEVDHFLFTAGISADSLLSH